MLTSFAYVRLYLVTMPEARVTSMPATRRAMWALGGISAVACIGAVAMMAGSPSGPVMLGGSTKSESLESQLRKTSNMVNGFAPIPASTHAGGMAAGLGVTAKPTTQNLGLHGMSQADFEKKVDKEVTSRVAQAILATMRPLKRVLKEQQDKIDMLEHRHTDHAKTEARIASRLSSDLKSGLLDHLKSDVDKEIERKLTPNLLLKAEKARKALKRLKTAHGGGLSGKASSSSAEASSASDSITASPAAASASAATAGGQAASKALEPKSAPEAAKARGRRHGAKGAQKETEEENVEKEVNAAKGGRKGKKGCDPVRNLYRNGAVSWC